MSTAQFPPNYLEACFRALALTVQNLEELTNAVPNIYEPIDNKQTIDGDPAT